MNTYTLVDTVLCRNVSPSNMALAWAAIPTDANLEHALALTKTSDTTVATAAGAQRTVVYQSTVSSPIPDPLTKDALTGVYTQYFGRRLCTPVRSQAVIVT